MSPLHGEAVNSSELVTTDSAISPIPVPSQPLQNERTPVDEQIKHHHQQQQQQNHGKVPQDLKYSALDYVFWKVVGEGSFSTVFLATDIRLDREFAIKVCEKKHIVKERKVEYVKREKEVLSIINSRMCTTCPFFVKLYHTFHDKYRLYFVLSYASNGDLLPYINGKKFNEKCVQFYAAEILRALEHMHRLGIIHRDLKPENILLNENMHILLTDFGSAKILENQTLESEDKSLPNHRSRSGSFVGTAQYVSPELLNEQSVSFASDFWALGCIIYQMVEGHPPFCGRSEAEIFQKIRKLELNFKDTFEPKTKDIVLKLLVLDASSRLGALDRGQYDSVRSHSFFLGVNFECLYQKTPPLQPLCPIRETVRLDPKNSSVCPGLDNKQLSRLLGLTLYDGVSAEKNKNYGKISIASILSSPEEISGRLHEQTQHNEWHLLVEGNLILRHGLVFEKKGLWQKKRLLFLTTGPHLYYADPINRVLKGEVSWSSELHEEAKNFKTFFVHTPERTFRWDDPEGNALVWCEAIKQVRSHLYGSTSSSRFNQ
ncbi:3-phosphoinositide-dependent protein kinase 1 [Gryllus bimaculatus]|nr:3-phosphoinositide-dependent protein kinase 1 [Gryllus bimaculatus]